MRSTFYFPHDYNARNDERITQLRMRCGAEGYGIFWMMIEAMHESDGEIRDLAAFAFAINCSTETVVGVAKACLEVGLLEGKAEGGPVYSSRVKEQLETRREYLERQREFGRRGGLKKAKTQGYPKGGPGQPRSQQGEERREKEMKEEKPKEERRAERTPDELGGEFTRVTVENAWCDEHYADKTWRQGMELSARPSDPAEPSDREEFLRKVRVMLNSATHVRTLGLARKVYHEIAAFVNDRGAMQGRLSTQEKAARDLFREETGQDLSAA